MVIDTMVVDTRVIDTMVSDTMAKTQRRGHKGGETKAK